MRPTDGHNGPDVPVLSGPRQAVASGGPARQLVVLLHGWGADGADLIGLAPHWARQLPDAEFVAPDAPEANDMGPGRQWFSLRDLGSEAIVAGVQAAAPTIDRFIDAELARLGLGPERLAMVGFSQGTMMALHVAPRRQAACAAVLGYSGRLIGAQALAREARSRPPVMLIHGEADEVVPAAALAEAETGLAAAGFEVAAHLRPGLGHGIDPEGLALGGRFIAEALAGG